MEEQLLKNHQYLAKASASLVYGILVAVAMNIFWTPGHIYSSGYTGLSQLIATVTSRYAPFTVPTAWALLIVNIPTFILAWKQIGHQFTLFTFLSVCLASIMIRSFRPMPLTRDPMICTIFGGLINGFGTGFALRNQISTGGLDILGIVVRRKTGRTIGTVNICFNALIVIAAGALYGWPYAFYSAIGLVINARMIDYAYTQQQRMQVIVVTNRPQRITHHVQTALHRGVTVLHDAAGAYHHQPKVVLLTVVSRYEIGDLERIVKRSDPNAFASISEVNRVIGNFYEPKIK